MEDEKLSNNPLTVFVLSALIFSGVTVPALADTVISNTNNAVIALTLAPSHVEAGNETHEIGYVNLINTNGILVKSSKDVTVSLKSENPTIAKVPAQTTIKAYQDFGTFDIQIGQETGETVISASFNGQTVYQKFIVGESNLDLPDDVNLVIHLPTQEMHVDSEMPYSIFLQTPSGEIIQAPYDIEVSLIFEDSLIGLNSDRLVIEKGDYYAWGIISTNDKVGNAFLRAEQLELNLHSAQSLKISSSFPAGISVDVFPKIVGKEVDRYVDIIVSLVDSDGFPTLAQEDIKLEFFSDDTYVGEKIDKTIKETGEKGIIKKGDFSFHFKQKLTLSNSKSEIKIGASTSGLGIASDCFMTREPITAENPSAENKTMHVFTLDKIPSNSKSVAIYQIGALVESEQVFDEDDEGCIDLGIFDSGSEEEGATSYQFKPILSNEYLSSEGGFEKINLISSDRLLMNIDEFGKIDAGYSYGTANIITGKETGEAVLSATIKGIGSGSTLTEIINTLKHEKTMIFSPTGPETILFDKNGNFDLFLISLDGKDRPTFVENEAKYLVSPVNELLEIERNKTFAHASFHSNSFGSADDKVVIEAIPIGISADEGLESIATYQKKPSAEVKIILPYNEINANTQEPYRGIVQIIDFRDNPIKTNSELKVKLSSSDSDLISLPRFVNIPEGKSFETFTIQPSGKYGEATIDVNANGVVGSSQDIITKSFFSKLAISSGGVLEPLPPSEPIELKLYVDSDTSQPVEGAELKIVTNGNSSVTPKNIKTEADGSAKIHVTPLSGPLVVLEVYASADGYVNEKKSFEFAVQGIDYVEEEALVLGFPDWAIYVAIAGILVIVTVLLLFLRKPKKDLEDEDEIYEVDDI